MLKKQSKKSLIFGILGVSIIIFLIGNLSAVDIFVDQTLSNNCTGDYSENNRDCSRSDGDAYITIQAAVNNMDGGDDIYLRGGEYDLGGKNVFIPWDADGTKDDWSSIQSYPGEWAVLDGENNISEGSLLGKTRRYYQDPYAYWKFERLEIKRAGNDDFFAAIGIDDGPFIIRYCYIHDCSTDRAGIHNSGAIRGYTWHDSIIEYNIFENNGGISDNYGSDICIFSDYKNPFEVDINSATRNNTIKYNYFLDGQQSIKYKSMQYLSLNHSGNHRTYKKYGDNIHHNIIKNADNEQHFNQDFIQVHNNIFDNCGLLQSVQGSAGTGAYRVFYHLYYNNLFTNNTRFHLSKNYACTSEEPRNYCVPEDYSNYHPYSYFYNNIIEDVEGVDNGRNDFSIFFSWSDRNYINDINWNTVDVNYNLFYPDTQSDEVLRIGHGHDFSVNSFESNGYGDINYAVNDSGLHSAGRSYKTNPDFELGRDGTTIANGGIGGEHPYLENVTIPDYVGAVNPEDDAWVDGVLGLADVDYLKNASSGNPNWVEGSRSSGNVCGDSICNTSAGENCDSCPSDCLDSETEVCCSGTAYSGECCVASDCSSGFECNITSYLCYKNQTQTQDCIHEAEIEPCDGVVSFSEIENYMNRWLNGEITIDQLLDGINKWKVL